MRRSLVLATSCALASIVGAPVLAQAGSGGTISHNNASFTQGDSPTDPTGSGATGANFFVGGSGNPDHFFQTWWWLRNQNDTREFALANASSWSWSGRVGQLDFSMPGADVTLTYLVTGFGNSSGALTESLTIRNTSSQTLRWDLFHYLDADLGGSAGGDSANLMGANVMRITDGPWQLSYEGSGTYAVDSFPSIRDSLTDGAITNFGNTGLPFGPGDWTGGWQFTLTLAPGEIATVSVAMSIVPAPGAVALLAAAGLIARRRRRD